MNVLGMNLAAEPAQFRPESSTGSGAQPGQVLAFTFLGREDPLPGECLPAVAFAMRLRSTAAGGADIVAKLLVPLGTPPAAGWPVSVWVHGMSDPAADWHRWPFSARAWPRTRGQLPARWAHHGIATLVAWLPGAGPSQPFARFSPMSLERNVQAVLDTVAALEPLVESGSLQAGIPDAHLRLDLDRLVLRAECAGTLALVRLAAEWRRHKALAGLRALVVDDFVPSYAYNTFVLSRPTENLAGLAAAAAWSTWVRVRYSHAEAENWPLETFFNTSAIKFFSAKIPLHGEEVGRVYARSLSPAAKNSLVPGFLEAVARDVGPSPTGRQMRDWLFADEPRRWMELPTLQALVEDPYYRNYGAASDPFFAENIRPFSLGIPLLVIGRADRSPMGGLPSLADRYRTMTLPRLQTLRSWGWDVRAYEPTVDGGTSYSGQAAQRWTLEQLEPLLECPHLA